ncbi:MAG: hypothetical protein V7L29_26585 [Nostoc sp.]
MQGHLQICCGGCDRLAKLERLFQSLPIYRGATAGTGGFPHEQVAWI